MGDKAAEAKALVCDKKLVVALFAVFFILESILAIWTGHEYDMSIWFNTGKLISQGANIYLPQDHIGYPPLWPLWCGASYSLYLSLGANIEVWRYLIKLPLIIAHLALAYAVAAFAAKRFGQSVGRKIFLFALAWSFFIFVGAMWGQINVLSALLTFLAFQATVEKHTDRGAVFLGLAIALKIYPLVALPAFLIYVAGTKSQRAAAKFLAFAVALPAAIIGAVFAVFQWNPMVAVGVVLNSSPSLEASQLVIAGGCMNVWSFIGLFGVDMAWQLPFRMLWLPLLLGAGVWWFRKGLRDEAGFAVAIVSFYVLFMVSFPWVSEQSFLDLLPFLFLIIFAYRPRRVYLYFLVAIQLLIYLFTVANQNLYILKPLLTAYSPSTLQAIDIFYGGNPALLVAVRGLLGLLVSVSLLLFLAMLLKPELLQYAQNALKRGAKKERFDA
ncbi:MAG: DUF2029 domain-containing protein [Candidatus Bathyarchaeota archaeon]|nr:DUF2029 domain-containing protein [Candidatus Bathyarchaeota archaeon]